MNWKIPLLKDLGYITEAKDHLINKNPNLNENQKAELIAFFRKYPHLESKIEWQKNPKWEDFEKLLDYKSETQKKKEFKDVNIDELLKKSGTKLLWEKSNIKLIEINSYEASKYCGYSSDKGKSADGGGYHWCISSDENTWNTKYTNDDNKFDRIKWRHELQSFEIEPITKFFFLYNSDLNFPYKKIMIECNLNNNKISFKFWNSNDKTIVLKNFEWLKEIKLFLFKYLRNKYGNVIDNNELVQERENLQNSRNKIESFKKETKISINNEIEKILKKYNIKYFRDKNWIYVFPKNSKTKNIDDDDNNWKIDFSISYMKPMIFSISLYKPDILFHQRKYGIENVYPLKDHIVESIEKAPLKINEMLSEFEKVVQIVLVDY